MDIASRAKLAIIATMVMMELTGRLKPSDNFIVNAHTTSNKPATNKRSQAMTPSYRSAGEQNGNRTAVEDTLGDAPEEQIANATRTS